MQDGDARIRGGEPIGDRARCRRATGRRRRARRTTDTRSGPRPRAVRDSALRCTSARRRSSAPPTPGTRRRSLAQKRDLRRRLFSLRAGPHEISAGGDASAPLAAAVPGEPRGPRRDRSVDQDPHQTPRGVVHRGVHRGVAGERQRERSGLTERVRPGAGEREKARRRAADCDRRLRGPVLDVALVDAIPERRGPQAAFRPS